MGDEYPTTLRDGELHAWFEKKLELYDWIPKSRSHLTEPKRAQSHSFFNMLPQKYSKLKTKSSCVDLT
jgi:hypothetical protein